MIESIEITNWKTHKKTKLSFQKGVNVLIGVMGAGKSSTMDAISYALFGTFPALNSKRVSLQELITSRPTRQEEAEVKLDFAVGDSAYTVTRKIGGDGNSAKLEKNGRHFQSQPTKVTEEIEDILKIDYDTFSRVVYAEQNRLDYFLELAKGKRKQEIDHMLGLDTFATAEENSTSLINNMQRAISYEEEVLSRTDLKALKENLSELAKEREALLKKQDKLKDDEKEAKTESTKKKQELERLREGLAKKKQISEEIKKLEGKVATFEQEIKKIEAIGIDEEKVKERHTKLSKQDESICKEIKELEKSLREGSRQLSDLEASIKELEKRAKEREKLLAELKGKDMGKAKEDLDSEGKTLQELNNQIAANKSKIEEIKEWSKELTKHISKCPVCERELDPDLKKKILDGKMDMMAALESESSKHSKSVTERSSRVKELTELINRLTVAKNMLEKFKDIDSALERDEAKRKEAAKSVKGLEEVLEKQRREYESIREELGKAKSDMQTIERKRGYEADIKKESHGIEAKKRELERLDVDEKSLEKMQESYTKSAAQLAQLSSEIEGNTRLVNSLSPQIKEKEGQLEEYTKTEQRIEKKRKQLANLNKFKGALIETEAQLRNRLVSSINGLMQGFWPSLYPYGDYTQIRLDARKDDYLLEVNTGDSWVQVDGIASGGERSIACLTMRIALAMVIVPNLKWLILDEPTHNIDSAGISKLIGTFGDALPKMVEQIFIITHDDNLKQISAAKVYLLDREKATHGSTTASEI